jgi:hypothetical protein
MPLQRSSSPEAFKSNVRTLMGEVGKSPHVQSRKQALAIAYETQRRAGRHQAGGEVTPREPDRDDENQAKYMWDRGEWDTKQPGNADVFPRTREYKGPERHNIPNIGEVIKTPQQSWSRLPSPTAWEYGVRQAFPFAPREEGVWGEVTRPEVGGLVNHDRDPDLPPVRDHADLIPVMPPPRGYRDPAYLGVIQRLLEGQRRLNAMHPLVREQLRRYWLGGLIRRMYGGSV